MAKKMSKRPRSKKVTRPEAVKYSLLSLEQVAKDLQAVRAQLFDLQHALRPLIDVTEEYEHLYRKLTAGKSATPPSAIYLVTTPGGRRLTLDDMLKIREARRGA